MSLGKNIEHEFRVKGEVKDKIEQNASPDEKVIDPRPILREERDLNVDNNHQNSGDHSTKERHRRGLQALA